MGGLAPKLRPPTLQVEARLIGTGKPHFLVVWRSCTTRTVVDLVCFALDGRPLERCGSLDGAQVHCELPVCFDCHCKCVSSGRFKWSSLRGVVREQWSRLRVAGGQLNHRFVSCRSFSRPLCFVNPSRRGAVPRRSCGTHWCRCQKAHGPVQSRLVSCLTSKLNAADW